MNNPFMLRGYSSPEYFCDRRQELIQLQNILRQNRNITLHSLRRLGKTGLIHHLFHHLNKKRYLPIFIDIYKTQNQNDFVNNLVSGLAQAYDQRYKVGALSQKITSILKGLALRMSLDPLSGAPKISLELKSTEEIGRTLDAVFLLLTEKKLIPVIAIDEFQQVERYSDSGLPALLRELMQKYSDVRFIFSGSEKHLLLSMFNADKPLFRTTEFIQLEKIDKDEYSEFIQTHFRTAHKTISEDLVLDILDWTSRHTYYVQEFCNRLFGNGKINIKAEDVLEIKQQILKSNEPLFYNYRKLLTKNQWNLLKAIAKSPPDAKLTSAQFIRDNNLTSPSSVSKALTALIDNDMVYEVQNKDTKTYHVYDIWHSRWLEAY